MTDTYHKLANVVEIQNANELTIPRARALYDAILHQRDYSLVQILRHSNEGSPSFECLVVEVECDGVPPHNTVGIHFRERLALCVPNNPQQLIDALALRQGFPVLMHQNHWVPEGPASLCLYFEPPAAVTRTWTPQTFLRRIQWWLEKSAREELHPADQPVEQLFFVSKFELVVPWNLDALRREPNKKFVVVRQEDRANGGFISLLLPFDPNMSGVSTLRHVELALPPVVHGVIERDAATLGQLADMLATRDVDLMTHLRAELQAGVGSNGAVASNSETSTIIVLHIPMCRAPETEAERTIQRAYLLPVNSLELGVACGALLVHEGRYYQDVMNSAPSTQWREQPTMPMEVLKRNDVTAARQQSGITVEGPKSVLIGAGSLGGAMLNLWGRSGWGQWTVIDKDHIKPHNLSRHVAYAQHIGEPKAKVVADLHAAVMLGASTILPVVADACDVQQTPVADALAGAALVVDASTTLEYPRLISAIDALPRHVSVFITPDGNGAVLLAEDARRLQRLRTLEAQYYRAVIEQEWGGAHLSGHVGRFWSGASCRDISFVLPNSRILVHAATLTEQVQATAERDEALIRVWQRHPSNGMVGVHDVPVMAEQCFQLGDLNLYIDDGVMQQLRQWRQQGLPSETGGVLLGYYDFNIKAVIVVAGIPAPADSTSSPVFFERGIAGLPEAVADASERTANMVHYIGEWHSHPKHCSAQPSRDDNIQLVSLAMAMSDEGLPGVQLIVGESDLHISTGTMVA